MCIINFMNEFTYGLIYELDKELNSQYDLQLYSFFIYQSPDIPIATNFLHILFGLTPMDINNLNVLYNDYYKYYLVNYFVGDKFLLSYSAITYFLFVSESLFPIFDIDLFIESHISRSPLHFQQSYIQANNYLLAPIYMFEPVHYNHLVNQMNYNIINKLDYVYLEMNFMRSLDVCNLYDDENFNSTHISFGFLISLTGFYKKQDFMLLMECLSKLLLMHSFSFPPINYKIYDIKADSNECLKGMKLFLNHNITHIFMGSGMYDCLIMSEALLNDESDVIIYYPHNSPGFFCNKHYIMLGDLPNQINKASLFYFTSNNPEISTVYIIYDSLNNESDRTTLAMSLFLDTSPTVVYFTFDVQNKNFENILDGINGNGNLIYIILPTGPYIIELMNYLYLYKIAENNVVCLLNQNEEEIQYFDLQTLDNIYLIDTTFSTVNSKFDEINQYLTSPLTLNITNSSTIKYCSTVMQFLTNFFFDRIYEPSEIIKELYRKEFMTSNSMRSLFTNNYIRHITMIARYNYNYGLTLVYKSSNGIQPDPFYWYNEHSTSCNFDKDYQNKYFNVLIVLDYNLDSVFQHFVFFYVDTIMSERILDYHFRCDTVSIMSEDMCNTIINDYVKTDKYNMLIDIMSDTCSPNILKKYDNELNKPIWYVSNYPYDTTYNNVFFVGLPISFTLRPAILELTMMPREKKAALIIDPKWASYVNNIWGVLNENGINLVKYYSSTNYKNIKEIIYDLIKTYPNGLHFIIEVNKNILYDIVEYVNSVTNNNEDGLFDYISFIERPEFFIKDPNYIEIGTYLHELTEEDKIKYPFFQEIEKTSTSNYTKGFPSIYSSFYISSIFFRSAIEKSQSIDYSIYKDYLYKISVETIEGNVELKMNNKISRTIYITHNNNDNYYEYKAINTYGIRETYLSNEKILSWNCTKKCEEFYYNPVIISLIIIYDSIHPQYNFGENSLPIYFIAKYFLMNYNIESLPHLIYNTIIYYYDINNSLSISEVIINLIESYNSTIFVTNFNMIYNIDSNVFPNDILIFNVGYGSEKYKSPIFSLGLSLTRLTNNAYYSIMKQSKNTVYILYHPENTISFTLLGYFQSLFSASSMNTFYIYYNPGEESRILPCVIDSQCVLINIVPFHLSKSYYEYYNRKVHNCSFTSYMLYIGDPVSEKLYPSLDNVYVFDTYYRSLIYSTYSFITNYTSLFNDFLNSYFPPYYKGFSPVAMAYDAITIYLTLNSRTQNYDANNIKRDIYYHEYNSPTGRTSFKGETISRYLYLGQFQYDVVNIVDFYEMYELTSIIEPSLYTRNIYIGIILDYGGNEDTISKNLLLLSDILISLANEEYSLKNISILFKNTPITRDKYDEYYINSLVTDPDITTIIGCTSIYCYNLVANKLMSDNNNNKIFFPLNSPIDEVCYRYIISYQHPLEKKKEFTVYYLNSINSFDVVIVYDEYSVFFESDVSSYITSKNITYRYYIYPFKGISMNNFIQHSINKTIINFITPDYLKQFESSFVLYSRNIHSVPKQIIFFLDEYQVGLDIMKQLSGNIICTSIPNDEKSVKSQLFDSVLEHYIGGSVKASQLMVTFEYSFSILANSYIVALNEMLKDKVSDKNMLKQYIQIATHGTSTSLILNTIEGTASNLFVTKYYLGEINTFGSINYILESDSVNNNTRCIYGKNEKIHEYPEYIKIITFLLAGTVILFNLILFLIIMHYRSRIAVKVSEPYSLIYLLFSSCLMCIPEMLYPMPYANDLDCKIISAITIYPSFNYLVVLVSRVYMYKIKSESFIKLNKHICKEFTHIFIPDFILFIFYIISIFFYPYSTNVRIKSISESTYIQDVFFSQCKLDMTFVFINCVVFSCVFTIGYYYCDRCRHAKFVYSDSTYIMYAISVFCVMSILYLGFNLLVIRLSSLEYIMNQIILSSTSIITTAYAVFPIINNARNNNVNYIATKFTTKKNLIHPRIMALKENASKVPKVCRIPTSSRVERTYARSKLHVEIQQKKEETDLFSYISQCTSAKKYKMSDT